MNKLNKKFISLLLVMFMLFTLVGCSNKSDNNTVTNNETPTIQEEVTKEETITTQEETKTAEVVKRRNGYS